MLKNSFIFLETIFSLIIISMVISSLFFILKEDKEEFNHISQIKNKLLLKDSNLTSNFKELNFITNTNEKLTIKVNEYTYEQNGIRLKYYE